jgi:cold shock CspA family protein/ribosome-associated translation inhibitor RaiA
METPVEIDFERCDSTERFRQRIEDRMAMLETRFGRITACRVTMRGPGNHHRTGGPYQVFIHIELPGGRQVDIDREPDQDERYADPIFAINDAFKRARRILQDNVRHHMQGQVKLHEERPTAVVRMIEPGEGYGFLKTADERDLYFHRNSVLGNGFDNLRPGDRVSFAEAMGDEGPQASTVRVLANHRQQ